MSRFTAATTYAKAEVQVEKRDYADASWRDLASKLERKLQELGIQLSEKDLHLLGDLEVIDARCQILPRLIEGLAAIPATPEGWETLGTHVGRLVAEMKLLKREASRIQAPLERLLSLICAVRSPRRHLEQASASHQHPGQASLKK